MEETIIDQYKQASTAAQAEVDKYKKLINTYSFMRLGIFALVVLAIALAKMEDNFSILAIAFVVLLFCFAWLVSKQSGFEAQRDHFQNLRTVNENEINSILQSQNIYNNGQRYSDEKHFYTSDLDIFGNTSLYQLTNRSATPGGNDKLADWLIAPASRQIILARQEAIRELASKTTWKLDLQARLLFANNSDADQFKNLFAYLRLSLDLPGEKWLRAYIKIAPYLLSAAIVGAYFYSILTLVAVAIAIFNMSVLVSKGGYIIKSGLVADKIGDVLAKYAIAFRVMETAEWSSATCRDLTDQLKTSGTSKSIEQLARLINKLASSSVMIIGFILNVFFLWALKQIIAIEDWKRSNKESLEDAFNVIAEFEALISLASLQTNYHKWCTPGIVEDPAYTLIAAGIGHPLINARKCVENSYELKDSYKVDIITGSNMAGKSTFLRTVGINTVLALSGAPVCANSMTVSVMTILSYMRIKDSLNESTSTFKAELDRLQLLLAAVDSEQKIFFLIDEMLRGTNSVDKYLGSKAVIEQLIRKRGVGMVATHDLQIAELETGHPDYVRNFYFDIQVKNGEMLFDYKIKHGKCETFNATLLLKQIGIEM